VRPSLASSVRARRVVDENEQQVRAVARELFRAVLGTGQVQTLYRTSAALADAVGEGLRVVLRFTSPGLAALPWEMMYDRSWMRMSADVSS